MRPVPRPVSRFLCIAALLGGAVPACPKHFDFVAGKTPLIEGTPPIAAVSAWAIRAR